MSVTLLKKNIGANFAGNIWQSLMGLLFVPVYIRFMGIESYGLVGIFTTLQGLLAVLDMGLTATLTREMARLSVLPESEQEMRDLARTLEVVNWSIAIIIGIVIIIISPLVANHWLNATHVHPRTVENAIVIMGFAMAFQWPTSFYSGGLMGLQNQVLLNIIVSITSTFRGVGAVLILWKISPTIQAFFVWQMAIFILNTLLLGFFFWKAFPKTERKSSFRVKVLLKTWQFAAGMGAISILATVLTQLDKVILSRMLTLEMFGYYTLAGVIAMSLLRLVGPVFYAVYPRFTQLVSLQQWVELKQLYHRSSQFISVLILPIAVVIALFSQEILFVWTQNSTTAEKSSILVIFLVWGTAFNGLMNIPYALQLSYGWTRLTLVVNSISIVILAPLIVFMAKRYGAPGGAAVWAILNTGYIVFGIHFMHKRLMVEEKWRWYRQDVFIPLITCLVIAGSARLLISTQWPQYMIVLSIGVVLTATLAGAMMATPIGRNWLSTAYSSLIRIK